MTTVLASTSASGFGITNYGELKDAVAAWLNRTSFGDMLPSFVRLAETTIRRDVRVRVQELFDAGTTTAATIATPALLLESRRLTIAGKKYTYIAPEQFQDYTDATNTTARHFTVIGEAIYIIGGTAGLAYSLLYWKAFEAFVNDTDTNWLLLNAPEIYLWSASKEGAEYLKDFEAADRFQTKYVQALLSLNASEKNMRFSGGTMQVRVAGSTP